MTGPENPPIALEGDPPRSAREEFVQAAVSYLLGERDGPVRAEGRHTSIRGGAGRKAGERPSASALGIRMVAELTGKSHAAPLFHFPDRLALVAAVAAEGFRRQTAYIAAELEVDESPRSARAGNPLERCAMAYINWASRAPALFVVMYDPDLAPVLEALMLGGGDPDFVRARLSPSAAGEGRPWQRRYDAYRELFDAKRGAVELFLGQAEAGIRDGWLRRDVPASDLAQVVISMADGLAWQQVTEQQFVGPLLEAHTRRMLRLCFEGLRDGSNK